MQPLASKFVHEKLTPRMWQIHIPLHMRKLGVLLPSDSRSKYIQQRYSQCKVLKRFYYEWKYLEMPMFSLLEGALLQLAEGGEDCFADCCSSLTSVQAECEYDMVNYFAFRILPFFLFSGPDLAFFSHPQLPVGALGCARSKAQDPHMGRIDSDLIFVRFERVNW